jgi:hypothetical protein
VGALKAKGRRPGREGKKSRMYRELGRAEHRLVEAGGPEKVTSEDGLKSCCKINSIISTCYLRRYDRLHRNTNISFLYDFF